MRRRFAITLIVALTLFSVSGTTVGDSNAVPLRIYLPREVSISDNTPNLGQIGIIRGDESLVAKAEEIVLGRFSVQGQEVTVSRSMLLSRLACNGIPVGKVELTGAEKVTVRQEGRTVKSSELVELAKSFLKRNPPAGSICQSELIGTPKDLILTGVDSDIKLVPQIVKNGAGNQTRVDIRAISGDKEAGLQRITFRHKYNTQKIVTLSDIKPGEAITEENVKIETTVSDYPQAAGLSTSLGSIARRHIPKDSLVQPNMVAPAKPAILVKRNQNVVIRIDAGGLTITAMGRMIDEGGVGDIVRVRNVDSQRVITAKVNEDGTLGPVL